VSRPSRERGAPNEPNEIAGLKASRRYEVRYPERSATDDRRRRWWGVLLALIPWIGDGGAIVDTSVIIFDRALSEPVVSITISVDAADQLEQTIRQDLESLGEDEFRSRWGIRRS
jgi:hypothetical protein